MVFYRLQVITGSGPYPLYWQLPDNEEAEQVCRDFIAPTFCSHVFISILDGSGGQPSQGWCSLGYCASGRPQDLGPRMTRSR
jgi:hypothetical protein